jgi:hypothetical protein
MSSRGKLLLAFALKAELASTVLSEQLMVSLCVPSCPPCLSANILIAGKQISDAIERTNMG